MLRPPEHLNTTKHYRLHVKTRCLWSETHRITTQARSGPQRNEEVASATTFQELSVMSAKRNRRYFGRKGRAANMAYRGKVTRYLEQVPETQNLLKMGVCLSSDATGSASRLVTARSSAKHVCVLLRVRNFLHTRTSQMPPNERP
jgi:hypothetical protein